MCRNLKMTSLLLIMPNKHLWTIRKRSYKLLQLQPANMLWSKELKESMQSFCFSSTSCLLKTGLFLFTFPEEVLVMIFCLLLLFARLSNRLINQFPSFYTSIEVFCSSKEIIQFINLSFLRIMENYFSHLRE